MLAAKVVHAFLCEAMPENCILYSSLGNADSNKFARNTVLTYLREQNPREDLTFSSRIVDLSRNKTFY